MKTKHFFLLILALVLNFSCENTENINSGLANTVAPEDVISQANVSSLSESIYYSRHFQQLLAIQVRMNDKVAAYFASSQDANAVFNAAISRLMTQNQPSADDLGLLMSVLGVADLDELKQLENAIKLQQDSLLLSYPQLLEDTPSSDNIRKDLVSILAAWEGSPSEGDVNFRRCGCLCQTHPACSSYEYCQQYQQCVENAWLGGFSIFSGAVGFGGVIGTVIAGPPGTLGGSLLGGSFGLVYGGAYTASSLTRCSQILSYQCDRYCPCP